MDEKEIVEGILEIAAGGEPDDLLELSVASAREELYDAAAEAYGSWDGALAAALCRVADEGASSDGGRAETIVRSVGKRAEDPIFAATANNAFFKIVPGLELEVTDEPHHLSVPPGAGPVKHLHHLGEPEGLLVFSSRGRYFWLDPRMIPRWQGDKEVRRLENVLDLADDEVLEFALARRTIFGGRIVHVTAQGKGKATETSDYDKTMDREGRTAFKLNDGDRPVAVMALPGEAPIFCASAHGRGILFPDDELRSMGTKAVGNNVMKVDADDDRVVGAFVGRKVEQVAVLTEEGFGKRVDFDEFRPQGRAGAGMQLCRLNKDDRVTGIAPCHPSDDLVVSTSAGRIHRRPAGDFSLMGRPAKGNRMVELGDGETVVGFTSLPCGSE